MGLQVLYHPSAPLVQVEEEALRCVRDQMCDLTANSVKST